MKIAYRRGHQRTGQDGCAVSALLNEIDVASAYGEYMVDGFRQQGHEVLDCTPPEGYRSLSDSLNYGINKANEWGADIFISCHVNNAFDNTVSYPMGCEVMHHRSSTKGQMYATQINNALHNLGFKEHQGAYADTRGLAEMRSTNMPAVIVEPFFIESEADVAKWHEVGAQRIGYAIVKAVTGEAVNSLPKFDPKADPTVNVYAVTEYLPNGYQGNGVDDGIDIRYVNQYMCGVWWKLKYNSYGQWAVTELLDPITAKQVREALGTWFCEFRLTDQ